MTKTKKTNKTELVVMGYFVEQITDIYGMFVGSNESIRSIYINQDLNDDRYLKTNDLVVNTFETCLLYTSPSPRDRTRSRMPSSA